MRLTVREIAEAAGGKVLCGNPETICLHLCTDSRTVQEGDLFVPVIGARVDSHEMIKAALEAGASAALTSRHKEMKDSSGKAWIAVEDTVKAMQKIGALCRKKSAVPAVGVTGSVGKTTTREMIAAALSAGKRVFKTAKNLNSQIGVPITLSEIGPEDEVAVLELGIGEPGEMEVIAGISGVNAAVVTNIGVAHIELLGSQDNIYREKMKITAGMKPGDPLFFNGDDPILRAHKESAGFPVILCGTGEDCDYRAEEIVPRQDRVSFMMKYKGKSLPVELSVPGRHNVINALIALAVADYFGIPVECAAEKLKEFRGFAGRLQFSAANGVEILDDTYNASPASMLAGLNVLADMACEGRRIAVLGDMLELGPDTGRYHEEVGEKLAGLKVDLVMTVGELAARIGRTALKAGSGARVMNFKDTEEAKPALLAQVQRGDCVYLKASRGMHLEELVQALEGRCMKIDGKAIARQIKEECRERAQSLKEKGIQVNLAVIQVGSDPASSVYVRNKKRACEEVGIGSLSYELPEETTEQELLELIRELNERKECSGILVQLPLPDQIDEKTVINAISPEKDVDGFHPVSVGKMLIGEPGFLPCTPAGVIQLLKRSGVAIEGKRCVVVGRSNIVGKPMAVLLLRENGTVTVAHSRTKDLKAVCREADILVAAVGKPRMITEEYIKPGAAVIDVGIHRDENNRLCGDVDTVRARRAAGAVTPVPGGVGPMTIAMLMDNCIRSAEKLFTGIS